MNELFQNEEFFIECDDCLEDRNDTILLKCEITRNFSVGNYKFNGIVCYSMKDNNNHDSLVDLFEYLLNKPKYRKVFLKNSFKNIITQKLSTKSLKSLDTIKNHQVAWISAYKWLLRDRIPYFPCFDRLEYKCYEDIPFLYEWGACLKSLVDYFNSEFDVDLIDAIKKCEELGLITKKYISIFCKEYSANIVYPPEYNLKIHGEQCKGNKFEGIIYHIDSSFRDFWFKKLESGKAFEVWFYYVVLFFVSENYDNPEDFYLLRNVLINLKDKGTITDIDTFIMDRRKKSVIFGECKNGKIDYSDILKFYALMKKFRAERGIFAIGDKYTKNIDKDEIREEFGIYIIDDLLNKDKDTIFKELNEVFEV